MESQSKQEQMCSYLIDSKPSSQKVYQEDIMIINTYALKDNPLS